MDNAPPSAPPSDSGAAALPAEPSQDGAQAAIKLLVIAAALAAIAVGFALPVAHSTNQPHSQFSEIDLSSR